MGISRWLGQAMRRVSGRQDSPVFLQRAERRRMDPDFPDVELGTRVRIGLKIVLENLDSYSLIGTYLPWLVGWLVVSTSITSADL